MATGDLPLQGNGVRIRAFHPAEASVLWQRAKAFAADAGTEPSRRWRETLRRRVARSGSFHDNYLSLALEADGRLVGSADVRRGAPMPDGVAEVGIEIFDAMDRGHGIGTRASECLIQYLFASGFVRVQATTGVTNSAARAVLEKLGFREEGTLRAYLPRRVGRENAALYALIRDEERSST